MSLVDYRPCVGIVLINKDGFIFVGERFNAPGAWQMPQGGVDAGEKLESAALRELYEETGVREDLVQIKAQTKNWLQYDLPDHLQGKVWRGKFKGQKQHWFLMEFLGYDKDIRLDMHEPEFSRWKWSPKTDVLREIVDFKRAVYVQALGELLP